MNNQYWEEQQKASYLRLSDDDIIKRIKQCQFVIDKLEKDELWHIVLRDANIWAENLDANWQYTYDDKLYEMRVIKHAVTHIKNLKDGYMQDLKIAQEELERRNNPDVIERDMEN